MSATAQQAFEAWCASLGASEGVLSEDPTDPGNWTSGRPGVGELKGTKFGISAAAYPSLDIKNLSLADAQALRRADYWDKINGDRLPPALAFMVADAAYGSGPVTAARHLQAVLGVTQDGVVGEVETIPAAWRAAESELLLNGLSGLDRLLVGFATRRLLFESGLAIWSIDRGGWTERLFRTLLLARALA